jgi:transmembrane sensor
MDKQEAKALVRKYNQGLATVEEKAQLENWYAQKADQLVLLEHEINFDQIELELKNRVLSHAGLAEQEYRPKRVKLWPRIAAAAAIMLIVGGGLFYYASQFNGLQTALNLTKGQDIAPGSNKAVLTLGNGQTIVLTNAKNGELATENSAVIKKTAEGELVYQGTATAAPTAYNTITTPRGGQYTLTLSEGTKVVLNAASSLKYPTAFNGKDRTVELVGEGYFEVAHNKAKPFRVISKGQTVEVLGTHFNINSYADEPNVKTTLIEGSVNVNGLILKPNQQAVLTDHSRINIVNVNADEAIAWKDGLFRFDHTDIKTLMRQIARWYDVEVVYEGTIKDEQFFGKIERSYTLSEVLKLLEMNKVHVKLEGKRIIVSP